MVKFAYNNTKTTSIGHTPFELNYDYHPQILYEKNVNPRFKSRSADKLSTQLRELMIVYQENLHHAQELQKRVHDKGIKPWAMPPTRKFG